MSSLPGKWIKLRFPSLGVIIPFAKGGVAMRNNSLENGTL